MPAHRNPVDDKTRGARKRYGARAALWGLLTALYAAGRDHEAQQLRDELRRGLTHDDVLDQALRLPDLGRAGEGLVGWAAHRYHMVERSGDAGELRLLEDLLPRAAYSVMEWSQRASPRPHLFDMSVEEAYERAKEFLDIRETRGPRQGPVVFRFDDGWTVQELNTKSLLVDEGNHQHICVGQEKHGYPQGVAEGLIKVYSLRDADGKPHVTLTWDILDQKLSEGSMAHNEKIVGSDMLSRCAAFGRSTGMSDADLFRARLASAKDVDLSNANLRSEHLFKEDLIGARLAGADLNGAYMSLAKMRGADLMNAKLSHTNMKSASMIGSILSGANLRYAHMANANMHKANLRGADLEGAILVDANLRSSDLREANLRSARMLGAFLGGADLRDAKYNSYTKWPLDFDPVASGAVLTED